MLALRTVKGVSLLGAEAAGICLADAGCLGEHGISHAQAGVEIACALIEFAVV